MLGVIASVSSAGAPVLSSFTAAIGLDAPVEVRPRVKLSFCTLLPGPSAVRLFLTLRARKVRMFSIGQHCCAADERTKG